jgi:hypothetical protein
MANRDSERIKVSTTEIVSGTIFIIICKEGDKFCYRQLPALIPILASLIYRSRTNCSSAERILSVCRAPIPDRISRPIIHIYTRR